MIAPGWSQRQWRAMGSTAEVLVHGPGADDLAGWAVAEVERLEACWSRFRPGSELCALNERAGRSVAVSSTLWQAVAAATRAWTETRGVFDPTILPALQALGYDRTFADLAADVGPGRRPAPVAGLGAVGLDSRHHEVHLPPGAALDLGGIGKGLAADLVVSGLLDRGASSVLVSLGGDLRVGGAGPHDDGCWQVPVERPTDGVELGTFPLVDEALVQSTTCYRSWSSGDRRLHHLIDPRTGWPADTDVVAVIVTGPEAARSEAFAKAALVLGTEEGRALLDGAGLDGWFVAADGTVTGSDRVADDLRPPAVPAAPRPPVGVASC